ncbi:MULTISPECIES: VOC family protein [unclassified Colwellia]|jgi:catechol-2,3-dioxygenase|uniref:VOC family protein n=1 Tax=unclassified Colwellia TaxID=196834 RepID=UPI000D340D50|nr:MULTISPECIES: VOC family protein [unclassified Colwellia]AWB57123.1 glyoxalase [Colwellia sp. Arc7-D]MBA6417323.1 VOC family protein [Colwellia sp. 6M3]|tara:strand:- start:3895 stop:4329 length:435 start_codon:yes stop_codon:yes gene_type:complete
MCNTENNLGSETTAITTLGIHHLGLSVPNIKETAAFFIEQLDFNVVGEKPDYPAIFVSDGTVMLTLWQVNDVSKMITFDRKNNIGLHHFALKVANLEQLQQLFEKLSQLDSVEIEFAPEPLGELPIHHMMCLIPGGIRLELITA